MVKALYLSGVEEEELGILRQLLEEGVEIVAIPPDRKEEAISRAGEFDVAIGARVGREFFEKAERLKYFVIPFAGIPPQDLEVLPEFPHLTVLNSHFNAQYVAEHAWALLLASVKRICPVHERMKRGDWTPRYEHQWGGVIAGGTLLIIGYGSIGKAVARIAKAFQLTVKAVKHTPGECPDVDYLGTSEEVHALLPEADFIVVALPGAKHLNSFLSEREFGLMKPGVHIVNVGRGPTIDEEALYNALTSGRVAGAGIDTWWIYPKDKASRSSTYPSKSPLWELENVVFSPHRASHVSGRETDRMKDLARILNSIKQGSPINVVNLDEGY